jgi:hypothetical protein
MAGCSTFSQVQRYRFYPSLGFTALGFGELHLSRLTLSNQITLLW